MHRTKNATAGLRYLGLAVAAGLLAAPTAHAQQPEQLTILSGSPGGSWYPIAAGIAEILGSEGVPTNAEVGAGVANMARISAGEAELGMTTSTVPPMADEGAAPFNEKISNVKAVAVLFPSHQQIAVTRDSGVDEIADLAGQPFNCESVGNSTQAALVDVLAASGISEDDVDCARGSVSFGADGIKDGNLVGFTTLSAFPNATFSELFHSADMKLLPVPSETAEQMQAKNPGYSYAEIPAGTYAGQDEAIPTMRSDLMLIANESLPDEDAYWVVKTLIDRIDDVRGIHAVMRPIDPEYMANVSGIELHPGARQAFVDAGVELED